MYVSAAVSAVMFLLGLTILVRGGRVRVVLTDASVVRRDLLTSREIRLSEIRPVYSVIDGLVLSGGARKLRLDDRHFNGDDDARAFIESLRHKLGPDCELSVDRLRCGDASKKDRSPG